MANRATLTSLTLYSVPCTAGGPPTARVLSSSGYPSKLRALRVRSCGRLSTEPTGPMDSQGPTGRRTRCRAGRPAALTLAWRALALIASLAASNVHAQALHEFVVHELAPPVESKLQGWQTAAGLGYVGVTGNEPSTTVTARVRARYRAALWTNTIRINMLRTQVPGGSPVNRFSAMNQTRYRIGRASYVLGLEGVDRDPASGFDRRYTAVLGYGHQWWAGQDRSLRAEVGLGTRFSHLTNGTRQHELIGLAALYYQVQLSPDLSLSQGLLIEPGNLDVYVQSNTALHERLTQRLSLVLSFGINHDSKPPPGVLLKTNTITAVSLQYGF